MSEQEMDEAKKKKFQERFERISRRRFVQVAAVGGAAALVEQSAIAQQKGSKGVHGKTYVLKIDLSYKCNNTRNLFNKIPVYNLFKDAFSTVLDNALNGNGSFPNGSALYTIVADISAALKASTMAADTLRDIFGKNIFDEFPKPVRDKFLAAVGDFILPFIHLDNGGRIASQTFLKDPVAEPSNFLDFFSRDNSDTHLPWTFEEMLNKPAKTAEIAHLDLVRRAKQHGILRRHPNAPASPYTIAPYSPAYPLPQFQEFSWKGKTASRSVDVKGACAMYNAQSGTWSCDTTCPDESSHCMLDDNKVPTAGCDICPCG